MMKNFTMPTAKSPQNIIDIESIGLDQGAHLIIKRALDQVAIGDTLHVVGSAAEWETHLLVWCRKNGHAVSFAVNHAIITRGPYQQGRWNGATQSGLVAGQPGLGRCCTRRNS